MASPMAHGLFVHAIGESGGALGSSALRYQTAEQREAKDADFARTELHANTLAELRALPAEQLLAAESPKGPGPHQGFGPDVDGLFLPEPVGAIFAAGKQNDVAMIAGWNHDEGGSGKAALTITPTGGSNAAPTTDQPSDLERLQQTATKDFPTRSKEFLAAFPASTDEEALTRLQQYATDRFIALGTWKWLEVQTETGKQPAYRYRFDLAPPPDPARPNRYGAFHSDEIEYVFGNLDSRKGIAWRPEDYALSMQMQSYWVSFARTGNPNASGLPNWPQYTPASGSQVLYLSTDTHAAKDDLRDQFLFLDAATK
jgi:para-nitrobenzyl esterase